MHGHIIIRRNMKKYSYYLQIADLSIKINMPFKIKVKEESINFISNKTKFSVSEQIRKCIARLEPKWKEKNLARA